jgi:hypothetical protein
MEHRMIRRWLAMVLSCLGLAALLLACTDDNGTRRRTPTPPPTPSTDRLRVNGALAMGARLRVTLPSIKLLKPYLVDDVQVFVVLVDPHGSYSYLVYPANRTGASTTQIDLTTTPLDVSLDKSTESVTLWVLAVHNTGYQTAEQFGLDALAASLGMGLRNWLNSGDPQDDPLAAVVSASDSSLYDWFGSIDVLGQSMITFLAGDNWDIGLDSQRSADGGLNVVYSVQYFSAAEAALLPSPTPFDEHAGYTLRVDEDFMSGASTHHWYEGQDNTYANAVVDGAYQIRLTQIIQRDFGLSWGSIEDEHFENYDLEAVVRLVEDDALNVRYGIWFDYQDDYNFIYFGISNTGEYRVAVIQSNSNRIEIQDWTPDPVIRRGAATNVLNIKKEPEGKVTLGINGEQVATFIDKTFDSGSIAFFCYAETVPTTCRLERLRLWEPE